MRVSRGSSSRRSRIQDGLKTTLRLSRNLPTALKTNLNGPQRRPPICLEDGPKRRLGGGLEAVVRRPPNDVWTVRRGGLEAALETASRLAPGRSLDGPLEAASKRPLDGPEDGRETVVETTRETVSRRPCDGPLDGLSTALSRRSSLDGSTGL
ncbi:hypothetical protein M885DRAFT_528951 [Pelagophyceae sp. CCMP2097]|nr:hypothetical protein M885DRAFT_528951 [Pelagophyceae sp. CCMP2097]